MIRGTSRETCNYRSKETQCNDDGDDGETIIYNMIVYGNFLTDRMSDDNDYNGDLPLITTSIHHYSPLVSNKH